MRRIADGCDSVAPSVPAYGGYNTVNLTASLFTKVIILASVTNPYEPSTTKTHWWSYLQGYVMTSSGMADSVVCHALNS